MITKYVDKLIQQQLTITTNKNPQKLDIIFEGGLFNGSYQIGMLIYLKRLEQLGRIQITRLSGASVGAIVAFLYFLPSNDFEYIVQHIYTLIIDQLKEKHDMNIFDRIFQYIRQLLITNTKNDLDISRQIDGRLYITYHDIRTGRQYVKYRYHNLDDVFETIKRSCFLPFITNSEFVYKDKYIDGLYPYMFPISSRRRILNLNIINLGRLPHFISVKNERTNTKRILEGIIDIHQFFTLHSSSMNICSFVDEWNIFHWIKYYLMISFLAFAVYILTKLYSANAFLKELTSNKWNINTLLKHSYVYLLDKYVI